MVRLILELGEQSATIVQGLSISTIDARSLRVYQVLEREKPAGGTTEHLLDNSPNRYYVYISSQIQNLVLQKQVSSYGSTYLKTTEKEFKIGPRDKLADSDRQILLSKYFSNAIIPKSDYSDPTLTAEQEVCKWGGYFHKL